MAERIALFPLGLVVFPGEPLNLHIFEPRYRQMVKDCLDGQIEFGILPVQEEKVMNYGTLMQIEGVVNRYPDGRMDIRTRGLKVFSCRDFQDPMGEKLYAGGAIETVPLGDDASHADKVLFIQKTKELFELMNLELKISIDDPFLSFYMGHRIGLSEKQEYHLLTISSERDRLQFMVHYMQKSIPVIREIERVKLHIRMNGHFKDIPGSHDYS